MRPEGLLLANDSKNTKEFFLQLTLRPGRDASEDLRAQQLGHAANHGGTGPGEGGRKIPPGG